MIRPIIRLAALALLPLAAAAQEGPRLAFTLGAGVSAVPGYFGSDEVEAGPAFAFDLDAVRLGPLSFGSGPERQGLGFRGSFRYIPERSSEDDEELEGLDDVDATFEIGGGLSYAQPWYETFAVARYGLGGSEALVGEVGIEFIARPTDRLTLRAGPRILIGSGDYAATYFGVTADEAAASALAGNDLTDFDASGGVLSSGVVLGAEYRLSDAWGIEGSVRYERLQGDAASSPITDEDDQLSASVAVTRRFEFGF